MEEGHMCPHVAQHSVGVQFRNCNDMHTRKSARQDTRGHQHLCYQTARRACRLYHHSASTWPILFKI